MKHKQIRQGVFESNSSSSHSFTIDNYYQGIDLPEGTEDWNSSISGGEFGWEYRKFNDFETKASYLWTLVCGVDFETSETYLKTQYPDLYDSLLNLKNNLIELGEKHHVVFLEPEKDDWWYVDHGTEHWESFVKKDPSLNTLDGLWNFLTNESVWVFLGNDNSAGPPGFQYTPNQYAAFDYFVKVESVNGLFPLKNKDDKNVLRDILNNASSVVYHNKKMWKDDLSVGQEYFDDEYMYIPRVKYGYDKSEDVVVNTEKYKYDIVGKLV